VRDVIQEIHLGNALAGQEMRRGGFLFIHHGNQDVPDVELLLLSGNRVEDGAFDHALETGALNGVLLFGGLRHLFAEEVFDLFTEVFDVASATEDDLLGGVEIQGRKKDMFRRQIFVFTSLRLRIGGPQNGIEFFIDLHR